MCMVQFLFSLEPTELTPLHPVYLHKINWPEAEYLYELSVEDPRGEFGSEP